MKLTTKKLEISKETEEQIEKAKKRIQELRDLGIGEESDESIEEIEQHIIDAYYKEAKNFYPKNKKIIL